MKKFFKRLLFFLIFLAVVGGGLYLFRFSILKGLGNALIEEDPPQEVEVAFMLSGNPWERAQMSAYLVQDLKLAPALITTGDGISSSLLATGQKLNDAEVGREALRKLGLADSLIQVLPVGSSTFEESEEILGYSQVKGYKRIMIVSSKFHTDRVRSVFVEKFRKAGIEVFVVGADPQNYSVEAWWESEEGFLFVFNEYLKKVYYWWKY
ncbi:MAG: YdcF family protein [Bacteroidota bacterium]